MITIEAICCVHLDNKETSIMCAMHGFCFLFLFLLGRGNGLLFFLLGM